MWKTSLDGIRESLAKQIFTGLQYDVGVAMVDCAILIAYLACLGWIPINHASLEFELPCYSTLGCQEKVKETICFWLQDIASWLIFSVKS